MNRNSQNFLTELETDYSTIFGDKRNFSIHQKFKSDSTSQLESKSDSSILILEVKENA